MHTVTIVGKPNVGKSSLFNRIVKQNKAIVDMQAGVTRDLNIATAEWFNQTFEIVDTSGLQTKPYEYNQLLQPAVLKTFQKSSLIIFLVSYLDGIDDDDLYIARLLKQNKCAVKTLLVANKTENKKAFYEWHDYLKLGFGHPIYIATSHGMGLGDLLEKITTHLAQLPKKASMKSAPTSFAFCLIGKTNVGKSHLVNTILNEERVLVSNQEHTTRDAIDTSFTRNKKNYTIIDTAGIRKKSKLQINVDKYAYLRVVDAVTKSQLVLVVLDATNELTELDKTIAGIAFQANLPTILVVNKWDAVVAKDTYTMQTFEKKIRRYLHFFKWAPIVYVSAKYNQRIATLFATMEAIQANLQKQIPASQLQNVLNRLQMVNMPAFFNGGRLKIYKGLQVSGQIPTFVLFCNNPKYLHFSYARYLENAFRTYFAFENVPLTLYFKPQNPV